MLIEEGYPYVEGYKPAFNYQELLRKEVLMRIANDVAVAHAAAAAVMAADASVPPIRSIDSVLVPAPVRDGNSRKVYERPTREPRPQLGINFLEREAHNSQLGVAGELFVLELEHRRLWQAGARHLAERIEHVSRTEGDGLGYDIVSFDLDGSERLIEVKTTRFGSMTPFFASKREVDVSEERSENFRLYRLFKFRTDPRLFVLPGAIRSNCSLDPVQFRASISGT